MLKHFGETGLGYEPRVAYACHPEKTKGRLFPETESLTRTAFQRDRDRVVHSNAFRRLKHKTQVFIVHEDDHYRTRLTHTIEVAQIARTLARSLRCDEELAEAIALAHDLGHPPFGHMGEEVLNGKMALHGGFDHNAQSFRIVTRLECRYMDFDGLNLTWETLAGLLQHNGPLLEAGGGLQQKQLLAEIKNLAFSFDPLFSCFPGLEAQCAAIADDIAYDAHDMDDGLRAGFLTLKMLQDSAISRDLPFSRRGNPGHSVRLGYEIIRHQINAMVEDVMFSSMERLQRLKPKSINDIYHAGQIIVRFSDDMAERERRLKNFLSQNIYQNPEISCMRDDVEKVLGALFDAYLSSPHEMSPASRCLFEDSDSFAQARHVADFVSGMTDTYALREYERLFGHKPFFTAHVCGLS